VIVYLDLEHSRLREDPELWQHFAAKTLETKYRLEAISGEACLIVHYPRATPGLLRELGVRAVVVSGHYTGLWHYTDSDLAGLRAIFRAAAWPTLAVCGGFHLLAQTYGGEVGPMQAAAQTYSETPLPPGIGRADRETAPAQARQERGFMPIRLLEGHPLFAGLDGRPVVYELHSWEIKAMPPGFRALAESELCRVQVLAHASAPLFGTQFHPEAYDEEHPDGRKVLENFLALTAPMG
jgi:GMP synthase-like glutamine amidotransferase